LKVDHSRERPASGVSLNTRRLAIRMFLTARPKCQEKKSPRNEQRKILPRRELKFRRRKRECCKADMASKMEDNSRAATVPKTETGRSKKVPSGGQEEQQDLIKGSPEWKGGRVRSQSKT